VPGRSIARFGAIEREAPEPRENGLTLGRCCVKMILFFTGEVLLAGALPGEAVAAAEITPSDTTQVPGAALQSPRQANCTFSVVLYP
jgi:hypothetical protein